jgi:hypothetical protein
VGDARRLRLVVLALQGPQAALVCHAIVSSSPRGC